MKDKKETKPRKQSAYRLQLLAVVDQYVKETGNSTYDLHEVALWGYERKLLDKPMIDIIRVLAKSLAVACRQDYLTDDNGEPVRHRHSIREERGDKQLTFWFKMEDATPEKMRRSAQGRRQGTLMDVLQLDRDLSYYNKKYNPGDAIRMDFNFNPDVEERHLPTEYPEQPPEDDHWVE